MQNPWADLPPESPYIAPVDRRRMTDAAIKRYDLKLDHFPVPWLGDPRTAAVILLTFYPSWSDDTDALERGDYAEQNRLALTFRSRVPLFSLDDDFKGTPGYNYWRTRLRELIAVVGLERVRHNVAVVEWFPYHSAKKPNMREPLPSQAYSVVLVEEAIGRGAVIV